MYRLCRLNFSVINCDKHINVFHNDNTCFKYSQCLLKQYKPVLTKCIQHMLYYSLRPPDISCNNVCVLYSLNCNRQLHNLNSLKQNFDKLLFNLIRVNSTFTNLKADNSDLTLTHPKLKIYLNKLKAKYENLQRCAPRDAGQLQSVMDILEQAESAEEDIQELHKLAAESANDQELAVMAAEDLAVARTTAHQLTLKLLQALLDNNAGRPTAGRDVLLELSAGVGGQEAMLFCQDLWLMYERLAARSGWRFVPQEYSESDIGGLRTGHAVVSPPAGADAFSVLRYEAGIHRVQRVPRTERAGRLHTSTAVVVVMLQPGEFDITIQPKDLKIETMRSSGAGGQSVNTTDSAIRITYLPTGLVVECQQERSQHQNLTKGLARLRALLHQQEEDKIAQASFQDRRLQVGTRARSEKIRTYNFAQDRVTDHRIGVTVHNVSGVLDGGEALVQLLEKLQQYSAQESLASLLNSDP